MIALLTSTFRETLHATFTVAAIVLFAWVAVSLDGLRARFEALERDGEDSADLNEHGTSLITGAEQDHA